MVKRKKIRSDFTKPKKWFWGLFFLGFCTIPIIFVLASFGVFGTMPDHTALENPSTNLATEIISSDGVTLGKFYFEDNRTPIGYNELPKHLIDALIATEDYRYSDHSGIDAKGTLRAIYKLGKGGGGSTISQQLAKQLFHGEGSRQTFGRITQKIKEWIIAIRLEKQYTKEEIIAQYFNIYDFGNNADGIRSAARIYFGKEPSALNITESAMLVGMFKNSSLYNPRPKRNPIGTRNRRNVVLSQMFKYGFINEATKDSLQDTSLNLNYNPESHREGIATYFRAYLKEFLKDWVNQDGNKKANGEKYNIYRDGLRVYTTIDSRMQIIAETSVSQHMKALQTEFFIQNTKQRNPTAPFLELEEEDIEKLLNLGMKRSERWRKMRYDLKKPINEIVNSFNKPISMKIFSWDGPNNEIDTVMTPMDSMIYYKSFLRAGMMSMEPQTGFVKSWVGGFNYKHFQYDMVKQGKRQVGSTFKPFVYAAAIDQLHLSPCDTFPKAQITIPAFKFGNVKAWAPKNSSNNYSGFETLKSALANSRNTITARLMNEIGPKPVINMAKDLGVEQSLPAVPSIALGTPDLSVYEMVAAYSTFANKGVYTKPVMVTKIEDKNGTLLYQFTPESRDVLSEEIAYVIVNLMEGVTKFGSGQRLRHNFAKEQAVYKEIVTGYPYEFDNAIAGKTGTTQNQSDGWFMGMVPNLVTGVWVGGEDRATHFETITYGQGASMALPIWANFMKGCYTIDALGISKDEFSIPEELSIITECKQYNEEGEAYKVNEVINPEIDF
ncbi:MAG: penicillin-binding protein [Flavobacteriaceae bacterium]|nr:penicillin-binding protein [Flavobacteriaceae bacterium]|tara:strand:+ start:14188 stop:16524 length:2337 start_codon:yes stop_codon:yes gene_type:complete